MPVPYRLNIFDQFGNVSKNLDEREIAKCSPEQQAVLFPLFTAWADSEAQDLLATKAEADKRKAQTALARAEQVLADVTPKHDFHDEWRRTVAKLPVPEPDPAVTKRVATATKVRDAAQDYLGQCLSAIHPTIVLRDEKRRVFADLLRAWSKIDGFPKTTADLIKERSMVETEQKMANLKAGLDPNFVAHAASTVGPSHLDHFRSGMGRGGSADYGYHQNRLRGAQLPPAAKLPSRR